MPRASSPTAMSPVFLSSSFSKSFSLYGERVGALSVVTGSAEEAMRVLSQLKRIVRTNYSNPPTHGCQLVATVLGSDQLRSLWDRELGEMRERIKDMRKRLVDSIHARVPGADFSFVLQAARHVLLLRAHQGAGAPAARGQLDLHHRHRPHLRRRAHARRTSTTSPMPSPR